MKNFTLLKELDYRMLRCLRGRDRARFIEKQLSMQMSMEEMLQTGSMQKERLCWIQEMESV